MIYLIGIILALFLSLILISKKNKTNSEWILFAWLLSIALNLILYASQSAENKYLNPFLLGWTFPFPLLHWAFLFLYVSFLTTKKEVNVKLFFHFIPFLMSTALFSKFLFLPNQEKIEVYKNQGKGYETQMTINLIAIILSAIIYTTFSIIRLRKYRKTIKNEFSNLEIINLYWLFYLIAGMTIIFMIIILGGTDKLIFSSVVGFVLFIGYFGIKQVGIFTQNSYSFENSSTYFENESNIVDLKTNHLSNILTEETSNTNAKIEIEVHKYKKSSLNEDAILKISADLKEIVQSQKLYKNAELTLDDLANSLKVLPNHLSQVINSIENKNFYDYINSLRIDEFIELISLPENQKFTLLSLAFECGFNSKTSFNRNFKKATGYSPSEYIKLEIKRTTE